MPDRYLQYIADQKRKERKQIERSTAALVELDRMERHYIKSGAAALAIHSEAKNTSSQLVFMDQDTVIDSNINRAVGGVFGGTLKERILALLSNQPKGLVSQEILKGLRAMGDPHMKRTSVSPQLSRLKEDGTLRNEAGRWIRNDEAAGSVDPTASSNSDS
jgi:hypothetical protein